MGHLTEVHILRVTLLYPQCSAAANTVEEAKKLIEAGFEFVCSHDETMLFRKRK
jgi:hypothetical protein